MSPRCSTALGVLLGTASFPTTAAGYRRLLAWARGFGPVRRAGVECTGSYGAALTRHLRSEAITVIEVNRRDRADRRRRGKTDTLDAEAAARAVLSGRATAIAKSGDGPVEMLRMFKLAKDSAVKSRTQAINQLKAVLVRADPALRESMTGLSNPALIRRCAELDRTTPTDPAGAAAFTLRRARPPHPRAHRRDQRAQRPDHHRDPDPRTPAAAPPRRRTRHRRRAAHRRRRQPRPAAHEASFAALCGVSPIEASSGKTQRRRLNRGGDRQANSALYTIVITRIRWDQRTQHYINRTLAEGKTRREAMSALSGSSHPNAGHRASSVSWDIPEGFTIQSWGDDRPRRFWFEREARQPVLAHGRRQSGEVGLPVPGELQPELAPRHFRADPVDDPGEDPGDSHRVLVEVHLHVLPVSAVGHVDVCAVAEVNPPMVLGHHDQTLIQGAEPHRDVVAAAGSATADVQDQHRLVHRRVQR